MRRRHGAGADRPAGRPGAAETRVPLQRTVDRIARWFVPLVILLALADLRRVGGRGHRTTHASWDEVTAKNWFAAESWSTWSRGLADLRGDLCRRGAHHRLPVRPGAGGPDAGGGRHRPGGPGRGAVPRRGRPWRSSPRSDAILIDKTGTLTEGKPWIVAVEAAVGEDAGQGARPGRRGRARQRTPDRGGDRLGGGPPRTCRSRSRPTSRPSRQGGAGRGRGQAGGRRDAQVPQGERRPPGG